MQAPAPNQAARSPAQPVFVMLATGGTIAGVAASAKDAVGYTAAQRSADELLASVPDLADALGAASLERQQVAQIDSKDMSGEVWLALWRATRDALARPEVSGVLITHGTDTLEETAHFLLRTLQAASRKPVVFTCAMRPATHEAADGPRNLSDALRVLRGLSAQGASGVWLVVAGQIHSARTVQKIHTSRLDAFASEHAVWAVADAWMAHPPQIFEENRLQVGVFRTSFAIKIEAMSQSTTAQWPRVELVTSHALASGEGVRAWLRDAAAGHSAPIAGIVVAGSGNGSLHRDLEAALVDAQAQGVRVVRASRCAFGEVLGAPHAPLATSGNLSAAKARVDLLLESLAATPAPTTTS